MKMINRLFMILLFVTMISRGSSAKPTFSSKPIVNPISASARSATSYKEPRRSGRDARRKRNMQRRPTRTKQVQKKPHEKSPYRPFKKASTTKNPVKDTRQVIKK